MKHGIVIPCYNESENLDVEEYVSFLKTTKNYEICFVNSGSTDNTKKILNTIKRSANTDNVYVYDLNKYHEKEEAIKCGVSFLNQYSNLEIISYLDPSLSIGFKVFEET